MESSIRSNTSKSMIRGNTSKSSESSIRGNSGDCSVNVGNNVSWKTSKQTSTTESIRDGKSSRENSLLFLSLTLLSLLNNLFNSLSRYGSCGFSSSSIGNCKFSLSSLNLSSVLNSNGEGKVKDWGNKRGNSRSTGGNGKVGSLHSESQSVGNILN